MNQIDPEFTRKMQAWLATEPAKRDIMAGATMLLQLTRNRAIYNAAVQRPQKMADKIEYELKKHLVYRLDNMTLQDVNTMQREVMPRIAKTVADEPAAVISTDDELPDAAVAKGRRADHDQLPDRIKALWEGNFDLYKKIKLLYNECVAMTDAGAQPCDLYERLKILDEADKRYHDNLAAYDAYVLGSEPETAEPSAGDPADIAKKISAARKNLSKWRAKFGNADTPADEDRARAKMQECVDTILKHGAAFSDETVSFLKSIGVNL